MKSHFNSDKSKSVLVFKRWSGKKYSVFNSLKKVVKITTLSMAYSILLLPMKVLCQTDTSITKNLDLEEIVISAQKAPVLYSKLARQVLSIKSEEIKQMPVSNFNDLLENFTGLDVRQRGANGIQADISIRGGSFDQNLILLNGVNISDPQTGHHSLNLPIDLNSIERIEILEGSGSRVFGPNAFSGAVNIITNESDKNYTKFNFSTGDFGLFSGSISSSLKVKNTKHFVSFSKSQSKGYTKNTDYNVYNLFYNSTYSSDFGKINFQIGYTDKEFGANSFYTPEYPDQFEQTKTTFTSLQFETGNKIKLIPTVYYRRHQDRFELFRYEPASWYSGHNYHLTDVYGLKLDSRISSAYGTTSFGAEIRSENIWSNVLGYDMEDTIKAIGESEGVYTKNYTRTISNYFLEHSVVLGKFTFSGGLLASWVSENDFDFNIYPGVDLSYSFNNSVRIYGSVNKSLRLPTFTDLFYSGPSNIGNDKLKPEEAISYELGLKIHNRVIQSSLSVFYRDSKNLIAWVKPIRALPEDKWQTQNLTNVETIGFQISNTININKGCINSIGLNYNYLNQKSKSGEYETKYSLNYLKHNLAISLNHKITKDLSLSWILKLQDREGSYLKYDHVTSKYVGEESFDVFALVDAKLSYTLNAFSIYAETTNLFNVTYIDIANVQMPGRWFKVGFDVQIGY
jgi:iron complex outermembrane receptor protein